MSFARDACSFCLHEVTLLTSPGQHQHRFLLFWEACLKASTHKCPRPQHQISLFLRLHLHHVKSRGVMGFLTGNVWGADETSPPFPCLWWVRPQPAMQPAILGTSPKGTGTGPTRRRGQQNRTSEGLEPEHMPLGSSPTQLETSLKADKVRLVQVMNTRGDIQNI